MATRKQTYIHMSLAMQSLEWGAWSGSPQLLCHKLAFITFPTKNY